MNMTISTVLCGITDSLRFSVYGGPFLPCEGPFHHMGAFLLLFLSIRGPLLSLWVGGDLFWSCPTPYENLSGRP